MRKGAFHRYILRTSFSAGWLEPDPPIGIDPRKAASQTIDCVAVLVCACLAVGRCQSSHARSARRKLRRHLEIDQPVSGGGRAQPWPSGLPSLVPIWYIGMLLFFFWFLPSPIEVSSGPGDDLSRAGMLSPQWVWYAKYREALEHHGTRYLYPGGRRSWAAKRAGALGMYHVGRLYGRPFSDGPCVDQV